MNLSSGRRKPRIVNWLHLCLSVCLLASLPEGGQAQLAPDRKREFLEMAPPFVFLWYGFRSGLCLLFPLPTIRRVEVNGTRKSQP